MEYFTTSQTILAWTLLILPHQTWWLHVNIMMSVSSYSSGLPWSSVWGSLKWGSVVSRCVLQLLDLFMVWDWSTYLADYGQPTSKYLRVNPATALALLEKWVHPICTHCRGCVYNFLLTFIFKRSISIERLWKIFKGKFKLMWGLINFFFFYQHTNLAPISLSNHSFKCTN